MGKLTFGQTGLSYQCGKVELKVDGAPKCPRCHQRVYFNEEKKAAGKTWHSKCFTCENCKKSLDSSNYNQHNGDQIYCTGCYRRLCGPQVYGFVAGAVLPTTADFDSKSNTVVSLRSSASEDIKRSYSSSDILENQSNNIDGCGRCGKRVYFAEEVRIGKKKWHKHCLRCGHCSKSIEPGKCSEHDGDLFCQSCYARFFGPRGYGYAAGNGSIFSPEVDQQEYSYFDTSKGSPATGATSPSGSYSRMAALPSNQVYSNGYNFKSSGSDDGYHTYNRNRYANSSNNNNGYGSNNNIFYSNHSSNNSLDKKSYANDESAFNNYGTKEWTEYHNLPTSNM